MFNSNHKFIGGGVVIAFSSLFVNAAMADATSARLAAYTGNKLIPQEIGLSTANTAKSGTEAVVVFEPTSLSWSSESAAIATYSDYMGLTKEDWEAMGKFFSSSSEHDSAWFAKALQYLGKIQSGELTNPNLSADDVLNLNDGKGVIIAQSGEGYIGGFCTLQPPFPKVTLDGPLYLNEVNFKGGIPDWDWSQSQSYNISFSDMKSSDLAKFTGTGFGFTIGSLIFDGSALPPMLSGANSGEFITLTEDCPLEYQIAVAKQNKGNKSVMYHGDFSDVDMTGWNDVYGTFRVANETYLTHNPTATVTTLKLRKEPADGVASRGFSGYTMYIGTLDCTSADISSTDNLPLAGKVILNETQFDSLKTNFLSGPYDYVGCVDSIVVKTAHGETKYSVKKTYDDEGFCIARELVRQ